MFRKALWRTLQERGSSGLPAFAKCIPVPARRPHLPPQNTCSLSQTVLSQMCPQSSELSVVFLCALLSLPLSLPSFLCLSSMSLPFSVSVSLQTLPVFFSAWYSVHQNQCSTTRLVTLWPLLWAVDLDQRAAALSRVSSHIGGGAVRLHFLTWPVILC